MIGIVVLVIALIPIVMFYAMSFSAKRPTDLGVRDGKLAPMKPSPNCVSSQTEEAAKRVDPLPFTCEAGVVLSRVKDAFGKMPRMTVTEEKENYLHVEATSLIFRFVDDVEIYVDTQAKLVHFRSASRVGYSDMDANRKRYEQFRLLVDLK